MAELVGFRSVLADQNAIHVVLPPRCKVSSAARIRILLPLCRGRAPSAECGFGFGELAVVYRDLEIEEVWNGRHQVQEVRHLHEPEVHLKEQLGRVATELLELLVAHRVRVHIEVAGKLHAEAIQLALSQRIALILKSPDDLFGNVCCLDLFPAGVYSLVLASWQHVKADRKRLTPR